MSHLDLSDLYDAHYYRTYGARSLDGGVGDEVWETVAASMAHGIVAEVHPETLLDVGCGRGFLVAALRDRGVEAFGLDFSPNAIEQVRKDVAPFCWQASILDPAPKRYDVVACFEVLEHLPPADAEKAVEQLCAATDDVLFSSTPDDYKESTHLNVRPPEYWAGLFAKQGFFRDVDFDPLSINHRTAIRFRKSAEPLHRIVAQYERRFWGLTLENVDLRLAALDAKVAFAKQEADAAQKAGTAPGVAALELTVAEQREHLDALASRLTYLSDRESDLRTMLRDAHSLLLERDERIAPLEAELGKRAAVIEAIQKDSAERLALIHRLTADVQSQRANVAEQQGIIAERAAQVEHLTAAMEVRDRRIADLEAQAAQRAAQQAAAESERVAATVPPVAPAPKPAAASAVVAAPGSKSLVSRAVAVARRQRGVWRLERGYRKLRRVINA